MTCSIVHSRKIPKIANFWTCSSVPPSVCLSINPPSLLYSSRKPPAWLWETASCLLRKKEKEIFPQAGCLLDKVFCLCTITGTRGGSGEGLCTETCHKMTETRYTCFNMYKNLLLLLLTTYWNVCFLHNAISPLLHWGNNELSIFHFFQGSLAEGMYPYSFNYHATLLHAGLEKRK